MPILFHFFPFNSNDWLFSENVTLMTNAQRGAYITLLARCWVSGTCTLPGDPVILTTLAQWQESDGDLQPVLRCFVPVKSPPNRVTNKRLMTEWKKAIEYRQAQQARGQKGAEVRWASTPKTERTPAPVVPLVDWLTTLKTNPAYAHINIEMELGKMDAWLSTKPGRKKTKSFVVNWLNKIEAPLASNGSGTRPPPPPPKNDPIGRGIWGRTYGHPKDHGYD